MKKLPLLILGALLLLPFSCKDKNKTLLEEKERELEELRQLAELDKREMENQYADFAAQYEELKQTVRDDSLLQRLDAEQRRAQDLLRQLKEVKSTSSAEILRLKKELETVRAVLRDYIYQVDSLQRLNTQLVGERDAARAEANQRAEENATITRANEQLQETVNIAAQLNATNFALSALKKNGKDARRSKDVEKFAISFSISRNVTAQTGTREVYVRLMKPGNQVVGATGRFSYENKQLEYSAARTFSYTGQEQRLTLYVTPSSIIEKGTYTAYVFCDGRMIGQGSMTLEK